LPRRLDVQSEIAQNLASRVALMKRCATYVKPPSIASEGSNFGRATCARKCTRGLLVEAFGNVRNVTPSRGEGIRAEVERSLA